MPQPGNNRMVTVITAYKESQATGATSDTTLAQLKGTHQLKIQGRHPPLPISSFDECGLPPKLLLNLFENKHTIPTPVQMQVIPAGLQGRDMLIMAETGSGKSASYLIPILTHVYGLAQVFGSNGMWASPIAADASDTSGSNQGPFGLILVPTRELAHQVETMAKTFARGLPNMLTAILVGGYAMANQAHRLRQNVQLVIATPGRLLDIMARHPEFTFSNVFCLVLDEVDMMFSLGFGKQVKRIMDILPIPPNGRQTIMCSATIPKQVEVLAKKMLMDPLTIQLGHPSSRNDAAAAAAESGATNVTTTRGKGKVEQTVRDESGADVFSPASRIKQTILWVENASKKKQLFSLLNDPKYYRPPVLVFVESRLGADLLATAIMQKCRGIETAVSMHAEKSQDERDEIMKALVEGTVPVVVATGLLARGLNLKVATVINFDMAPTIQEYVHRVGRANPEMATKAALGIRKGPKLNGMAWAITFINQDDSPLLRELATMLSGLGLDRVTPLPQQLKQLLDTKPLSSTTSHGPSRTAVVQKSSLKTSKERDKVKIKTTDSNSRVSVPVPPAVNPGVKIKQTKRPRPSQQKHQKSKKKRIQ
ncbi:DEAD (Asp-Glu-Ala-Asp) box polypeptide 59 [Podila epigama]|nr:DEAD (Asp-Glu-Ala-Asp) box polypeptide 59 [Podila epigama]